VCGDLEESTTNYVDHLQLGAQVGVVHVIEDPFNKEGIFC